MNEKTLLFSHYDPEMVKWLINYSKKYLTIFFRHGLHGFHGFRNDGCIKQQCNLRYPCLKRNINLPT